MLLPLIQTKDINKINHAISIFLNDFNYNIKELIKKYILKIIKIKMENFFGQV